MTSKRKNRYKVAEVHDLDSNNTRVIAEVNGLEVAVFRIDDEYFALANYCPHQAGPLCEGTISGRVKVGDEPWKLEYGPETNIECPWHNWTFNIKTGKSIGGTQLQVPKFEVEIEGENVYVLK